MSELEIKVPGNDSHINVTIDFGQDTVELIKAIGAIAKLIPLIYDASKIIYNYISSYVVPACHAIGEKFNQTYDEMFKAVEPNPEDQYKDLVDEVLMSGEYKLLDPGFMDSGFSSFSGD